MKRFAGMMVLLLLALSGMAQVKGYRVQGTKFLEAFDNFVWKGDTLQHDSIVYVDLHTDSLRVRYIDGSWSNWFYSGTTSGVYVLPTASATVKGGIKVGSGLSIDAGTGVLSSTGSMVYPGVGLAKSTGSGWATSITDNSSNWNTAYSWGNHATAGYLTSYSETDPIYSASSWYSTTNNSSNWNTAYTHSQNDADTSISNEGILGVGAGGASSSTITTNTNTGNAITINVSGINTISESTSSNGGSITITGTEVDGSISNEGSLTVAAGASTTSIINSNTSGQTGVTLSVDGTNLGISENSNTITLSNLKPDQTVSLSNGTGISTSGTYPSFTITNTAPNVTTNLSVSGTSSPLTLNSSDGTDVTITAGTGISLAGTSSNITVTNSSPDTYAAVTKGNLTESVTGLQFDATRQVIGGAATLSLTSGYVIPTTTEESNWNTAYTDRLKWDGGATGLTASTGRTSLGATTVGSNIFTSTNPSAITFLRANADNTISWLDATSFRTAIGAGTSSTAGTVTSVAMTVPTGLSISGTPITTSGTLALSLQSGYSIPTTTDQTNWTTAYTNRITSLTTTGSSGSATLSSNTLNIPNYTLSGLGYSVPTLQQVTDQGSTTINSITALSLIKSGGTSSQFLKADGSVDSNTYLTSYTETDPTIYAWAKAPTKPTYTYSEVGAQEPLISGTNIKTINGNSILGSGNLSISGGTTNLGYTASATNGIVTSDTGTDATIPAGSTTNASLMLPDDKTKLNGIASGADNYGYWAFQVNGGSPQTVPSANTLNFIAGTNTTITRSGFDLTFSSTGGSMVYPSAGLAKSTGSGWGTSITDNSSNWNDAHSNMGKTSTDGSFFAYLNPSYFTSLGGWKPTTLSEPTPFSDKAFSAGGAYTALNAKQDALSGTGFVKISGTTISYDNNTYALLNGSLSQDFSGRSFLLPNSINVNGNDGIARLVNGGHSFALFSNGDASVDGIFTASELYRGSSKELKHNIKPYKGNALDILNATKIYTYNLNSDNSFGVGFLAEDTHKWLSGENQKSHAMGNHLGLLTKAIQEQIIVIEEMQKQISDLQIEIKKLKKRQLKRK